MKLLSPTQHRRLNEVTGFLLLSMGLVILLSLVSYHAQDPSWDTAAGSRPLNLVGYPGSYLSDLLFQAFGATAFLFPLLAFLLAWKWIRSEDLEAGGAKMFGSLLLTLSLCAALSFLPWSLFGGGVRLGGIFGLELATWLVDSLNVAGAVLATLTVVIVSIYLVSTFTLSKLGEWFAGPIAWYGRRAQAFGEWRARMRQRAVEKAMERQALAMRKPRKKERSREESPSLRRRDRWPATRRRGPTLRSPTQPEPAVPSTPPSKRSPSASSKISNLQPAPATVPRPRPAVPRPAIPARRHPCCSSCLPRTCSTKCPAATRTTSRS